MLTASFGLALAGTFVAAGPRLAGVLDPSPRTLLPAIGLALLLAGAGGRLPPALASGVIFDRLLHRLPIGGRNSTQASQGWLTLGWLCLAAAATGLLASAVLEPIGRWNVGAQEAFLGPELLHAASEWLWAGVVIGLPAALIVLALLWHLQQTQRSGVSLHVAALVLAMVVAGSAGGALTTAHSADYTGLVSLLPILLAALLSVWLASADRAERKPAQAESQPPGAWPASATLSMALFLVAGSAATVLGLAAADSERWLYGLTLAGGCGLARLQSPRADGHRRTTGALLMLIGVTLPVVLISHQRDLATAGAISAVVASLTCGLAGGITLRSALARTTVGRGLAKAGLSVAAGWVLGMIVSAWASGIGGWSGVPGVALVLSLLIASSAIAGRPRSAVLAPGRLVRWSAVSASLLLGVLIVAGRANGTATMDPAAPQHNWCDELLALRRHAHHAAIIGSGERPSEAWLRRLDLYRYQGAADEGEPLWPTLRRCRARYDLVAILPAHERVIDHADDWTLELFTHVRRRLADHGVAACVVPLRGASVEQLRVLAATWRAAFGASASVAVHRSQPDDQADCLVLLGCVGSWPALDFAAVPDIRLAGSVSALLAGTSSPEVHSISAPRLQTVAAQSGADQHVEHFAEPAR